MQHSTMQCNSMQRNAMKCTAMQRNARQHDAMQHKAMQCKAKHHLSGIGYVDLLLQSNMECLEAAGNNSVTQYSEKEFENHTVSMIFS